MVSHCRVWASSPSIDRCDVIYHPFASHCLDKEVPFPPWQMDRSSDDLICALQSKQYRMVCTGHNKKWSPALPSCNTARSSIDIQNESNEIGRIPGFKPCFTQESTSPLFIQGKLITKACCSPTLKWSLTKRLQKFSDTHFRSAHLDWP